MKPELSVHLSEDVAERLTQAANLPGQSTSAIVDAALESFLNPERDQSGGATLVLRLDRMSWQLGRVQHNLAIMAETVGLLVREYFSTTSALPSADQSAARALAQETFEMFIEEVAKNVAAGGRLVADVMEQVNGSDPDEFFGDLDEDAPLGQAPAVTETKSRAPKAMGEPPEPSPERRGKIGDV